MAKTYPRVEARDRSEWHDWLKANHAVSDGVQLVFCKKGSGQPSVRYEEAVEEALAFGWIDSRANAIDEERYGQIFTPRRKGSVWSEINKRRVEKLIARGEMTAAGLVKVEEAKRSGAWERAYGARLALMPEELKAAVENNATAKAKLESLSYSKKKQIYWWVGSAKRVDTRKARARRAVEAIERDALPF